MSDPAPWPGARDRNTPAGAASAPVLQLPSHSPFRGTTPRQQHREIKDRREEWGLWSAYALAEFSYNFLEGSFVDVEIDDTSIDGDGIRLEGSAEVGDTYFVRAEYEDYDFDFNIDGNVFEVGGGYFHTLNEDLDFIAVGQYVQVEIGSGDDDGLGIGGGVRTRLADTIEVDAILHWVDLDDSGSDTYVDLRGRYNINEQFAVTLKFDVGSDTFDTMGIGVRYNFSPRSGVGQ